MNYLFPPFDPDLFAPRPGDAVLRFVSVGAAARTWLPMHAARCALRAAHGRARPERGERDACRRPSRTLPSHAWQPKDDPKV
jgi:hypothetical protein